jgi:hypothetical protein
MLTHAVRSQARAAAGTRPHRRSTSALGPPTLLDLQSLIGNRALQTLLSAEAETPTCACGGKCAHCAHEREDELHLPMTGPSSDLDPEELENLAATPGTRLTPLTPVPSWAGGAVVCRGGAMEVWINPTESACVQPCERRHEEKHIADFQADPNYRNACQGIPDGEQFTYRNDDDARRFETAATDVEIACLNASIPGASAACRPVMEQRRDVTLPAYKRRFESKGC